MSSAPSISPGTVFGGDYEVERPIAAGGMGAVYVARQRSTQKLRALKIMLPQLVGDAGLRSRFKREATVGSQIESDHVVEVLAAGIDEPSGIPWLAMELLAGDNLAKTVEKRGVLPRVEIIELLKQLGHALTAAHNTGVVHRDLKPENLFLATARREGVPFTLKVLDFGIAKIVNAVQSHATTGLVGSPIWMAPEQTDVAAGVSPATDLWTLGLIAFWLLTGRHYWLSGSTSDATLGTVMRELLVDPLPPASARAHALGVANRIVPGFDDWFARCVVRAPGARYQHAGQAFPPLIALLSAAPAPGLVAMSVAGAPLAFAQTALPYPGPALASTTSTPVVYGIPRRSIPDAPRGARSKRVLIAVLTMMFALVAAIFLGVGLGVIGHRRHADRVTSPTAPNPATNVTAEPPSALAAPTAVATVATPPSAKPPPGSENSHRHATPRHGEPAPALHEAPTPMVPATNPEPTPPASEPVAPVPQIQPTPAPAAEPALCMVEAGPLWNNDHAHRTCPGVCAQARADRYTGAWTTTRPGEMSVCQCAFPSGARCP